MQLRLLCLLFAFTQCSHKAVKSTDSDVFNPTDLNKTLETELGGKFTQTQNESKTYVLAIGEQENSSLFRQYVILEVSSLEIIQKGSFRPGYIQWKSNTSLELLNVPGTIPVGKNLSDYVQVIELTLSH